MRSFRLAVRLARRNLRRRPAQAALLLLTLTLATGMFGVGMALYGSADGPWDRVWAATDGFHVSAAYYRGRDADRADVDLDAARARFAELAAAPEVRAVGGPWTHLYGLLDVAGGTEDLTAEIRDLGRSPVDQPLVTAGSWLSAGSDGVVLEQGLADALDVGPGDTIRVQGHQLAVRGVAMTVSRGRFPLSRPAQIWITLTTGEALRRIGLTEEGLEMQLRLHDPDDAEAFATAHEAIEGRGETSALFLDTWRRRRADSHSDIDILAGTVFAAGTLIGLLTVATAAVIVGGRMAAQTRQIGTLKAVGVTPRQVVLALLVENLALAGLATLVGLGAGRMVAPRLAEVSQTVLGRPETPTLTWGRAAVVAGVAAAVVVLATVRPAVRGLRHSTVRSLASGARPPRGPGHRTRWAATAGLPLVAVLGLRSARRRPARLLTNAVGLSLAVALIVVAAGLRPSLNRLAAAGSAPAQPGEALSAGAVDHLYEAVRAIVLGTAGLLLVLATVNALIIAALAARDSARNHATLRALGATPRQTVATLIVSQLGACLLAVALGLPLGLGLWSVMDGGDLPPVPVPATTLLAIAAVVPLGFAALVAVPARRWARRPPARVLTYE
ncbi:MAG TPA: FtsX-like permease family protein [Acidimicrobiales bacterium]|nr:FtsX-like permease family protein [Acidimicrobiales bacterium]